MPPGAEKEKEVEFAGAGFSEEENCLLLGGVDPESPPAPQPHATSAL